ncbi:RraA family protein [Pseudomonas putida]|uniref:RraA family protein n=1 Tax=Pseudomonas putida TaxID=303 RepID=UPI00300EED70
MTDLKELAKQLYSGVLSDVMDELGHPHQAMKPFVRPVDDNLILMGRVRTGLFANVYTVREGEDPFDIEISFIDDLKEGDVAVIACNGPSERIAPWGELLTTASIARGAVGCVTDGLVRDLREIKRMQFPVYHGGIGPLDTRGRAKMIDRDCVIECGGVRTRTGDYIFGDIDGVVIIPEEIFSTVIDRALTKIRSETHTRDALKEGMLLRDVFEKFGVL